MKCNCGGTCRYISLLQLKDDDREEEKIVKEERSLLQSGLPAVHGYSTGESSATLTLSQNEA